MGQLDGYKATVTPTRPSVTSCPTVGGRCCPDAMLGSSIPSHQELESVMCGIYTSCMKPLLFSFPVSDLLARCFLAADAHLCHGVLRGTNGPETGVDLGFWLPSLHSGAPRELRDGVFQHQTGRDSLGKKCEVFSPFQERSSLQKVAEASLSGPAREGRQQHPTARTPHPDASVTALAQPYHECLSLCPTKWPPRRQTSVPTKPVTTPVPSSVPQPPSHHLQRAIEGERS